MARLAELRSARRELDRLMSGLRRLLRSTGRDEGPKTDDPAVNGGFRTLDISGRMVASAYTYPGVGSVDQSIHLASFDGCGGCTSDNYVLPK